MRPNEIPSAHTDQIVFLSHTHSSGVFKIGSHHLAREFAALGYDVAHISTPYSLTHAVMKRGAAGRREQASLGPVRDSEGVLQVVPRTIAPVQYSSSKYLTTVLRRSGFVRPRFMLVDQPLMASRRLSALSATLIYRPTDLYPEGIQARNQARLLTEVDGVIATSDEVLRSLTIPLKVPRMSLPNGVDFQRFAAPFDSLREGAIYVGALDDRFDWEAVRHFAHAVPTAPIRLVGPGTAIPSDLPPNVKVLGPVAYDRIPELLSQSRIGLLPFSDDVNNRGRSPMKLFEYLAAGLHVLSRETPVISAYNLPGLYSYATTTSGAAQYARMQQLHNVNDDGREAARQEDWAHKAAAVEQFLFHVESLAL